MSYLADTDVLANWLKGREEDVALLSSLAPEGLAISLITYGEIYDGIFSGYKTSANRAAFEQLLRWIDLLLLPQASAPRLCSLSHLRPGCLQVQSHFHQQTSQLLRSALLLRLS